MKGSGVSVSADCYFVDAVKGYVVITREMFVKLIIFVLSETLQGYLSNLLHVCIYLSPCLFVLFICYLDRLV